MPSRVSGNDLGVITTGGHKTLPYGVVNMLIEDQTTFLPTSATIPDVGGGW